MGALAAFEAAALGSDGLIEGPGVTKSGRLAIWVGGEEGIFLAHSTPSATCRLHRPDWRRLDRLHAI